MKSNSFARHGQRAPAHYHLRKIEGIINRGGGGGYRGGLKLCRLEIGLFRTASEEFAKRVLR